MFDPGDSLSVCTVLLNSPMFYENTGTHQQSDDTLRPLFDNLAARRNIPGYSMSKGIIHCNADFMAGTRLLSLRTLCPLAVPFITSHPFIRSTLSKIRQ
jgi:hypothetical protein